MQSFKESFTGIIWRALGTLLLFHGVITFMQAEFEPEKIKIIRLTESSPFLPEGLSGLKIAYFADLHWKVGQEEEPLFKDLLARVRGESPHLILIGGDVADQFLKKVPMEKIRKSLVPFLKQLKAPMGVFAVMGNHEAACGLKKYRLLLQEGGIRVLEGERICLSLPGRDEKLLELTGIPEKRWFHKKAMLPEKWKGDEKKEETFPLYFCHRPEVFDKLQQQENRPFILLSAHYHGGLFALPFLKNGFFINKRKKKPFAPYIYGLYRKGENLLYVTSGLSGGYFRSRCRINLPRELVILTLQKGKR